MVLIANAGEEHLFEVLPVIFLVFAYPDDAILNDVGHKHDVFVWLSTLIVWKKRKCYIVRIRKLHFFLKERRFSQKNNYLCTRKRVKGMRM